MSLQLVLVVVVIFRSGVPFLLPMHLSTIMVVSTILPLLQSLPLRCIFILMEPEPTVLGSLGIENGILRTGIMLMVDGGVTFRILQNKGIV